MPAAAPRRTRKVIGHRRRVEDEAEDEGGPETLDIDDDSVTEASAVSDDNDNANDSDTSNVDEASPTSPNARKTTGNGAVKTSDGRQTTAAIQASSVSQASQKATLFQAEGLLNGLDLSDNKGQPVEAIDFDEAVESPTKTFGPLIVSSASASAAQEAPFERRRREHDEYRKKRDEDPAFVPNRGAFFMHDHRHAGPSANGFRPFSRGARGRGRGFGGPFAPLNQFHRAPADPTVTAPWAHDMHETVLDPVPPRHSRHILPNEGIINGDGQIPTCPLSDTPINRTMSTEKVLGNVQVRVFLPPLKEPIIFPGVPIKQYTKLPDHRPPLRRDKPVRVSLPDHPPGYIFPAVDRSFIFIPRAMRPNQQRMRGRPRSGLGSIGGFSRRTSVFGGSYYGSVYSPSVAMSRRSSVAPDIGREFIISPTGSAISRPPLPVEAPRPVVRLPPQPQPQQPVPVPIPAAHAAVHAPAAPAAPAVPAVPVPASVSDSADAPAAEDKSATINESTSINDLPPPQTHPLPQKPTFQENRPITVPMLQPRPQKAVSVETIESPTMQTNLPQQPQQYQQAFHQQVPVQMMPNNFLQDIHTRNPSYPSQHSTGTPLSQIPERAIHAAPFQPTAYSHQGFYGQPYQMMPQQQGYYYPPPSYGGNMTPSAAAPAFVPGAQQPQAPSYNQAPQGEPAPTPINGQGPGSQNLVAQELNGMVYYYEASQIPTVTGYPQYSGPPNYVPGVVNMGVTSSPDDFYYPQQAPGMVYYPQ